MKKHYCRNFIDFPFYLCLFLFNFFNFSSAQLESSHWYFGHYTGLDFMNTHLGYPTENEESQLFTAEGCASISDVNGNLLFYTDGTSVYDKTHHLMPNGIGLKGNFSSTQSGIIVPNPESKFIYYLFTVDEVERGKVSAGLNYSIIDMRLNNGKGDVSIKNIPLPLNGQQRCFEKIAAVKQKDKKAYWVLTFYVDSFYVFSIDFNGVNNEPIISTFNTEIIDNELNGKGYLKISPDGTKIINAFEKLSQTSLGEGAIILYDFDNQTGKVSNERIINSNISYYGAEFSPNGKFAYVNNSTDKTIEQYDLDNFIKKVLPFKNTKIRMPLQVALDGRIYLINTKKDISVIENPNDEKDVLIKENIIQASENKQFISGLPPFISSFFMHSLIIGDNKFCINENSYYYINTSFSNYQIKWYLNNELIGNNKEVVININKKGIYLLEAHIQVPLGEITIVKKEVEIVEKPQPIIKVYP